MAADVVGAETLPDHMFRTGLLDVPGTLLYTSSIKWPGTYKTSCSGTTHLPGHVPGPSRSCSAGAAK